MPKNKKKGSNAERDVIHLFWELGWTACRVAGSGSMKYPGPDIIASKKGIHFAIECKITKDYFKYIKKSKMAELIDYSYKAGVVPFVALKFSGFEWIFVEPAVFKETQSSFVIEKDVALLKGKKISEITKDL